MKNACRSWTMLTVACAAILPAVPPAAAAADLAIDRAGIGVTESVRIRPGRYRVADPDGRGVLRVKTDGVVIDFQGATLEAGDMKRADLSEAAGVGIAIDGAKNVTIRNAKIHGYFFNIQANAAPGLKLENCDVSYSRAQRIMADGMPIEIWLVLRSLEAWRSYGAGIWIERSDGCTVHHCRGSGAQNGLLLADSGRSSVTECDFSFNSGFGIGLWGSSKGTVAWNRIDFVNRPWGGGWGGDSAALVVVNGSSDNYLVGNSMTHGGDGLFLTDRLNGGFSEQNPVKQFDGSCDRNLIVANDGSWSTANAFEGTFSFGNVYDRNIADDSSFGFWLGYSSDTLLFRNEIDRNRNDGVAIEHGHGNRIQANRFAENRGAAVSLWAAGPKWLLDLHPSRDVEIRDNTIRGCGRAFRLDNTADVSVGGNKIADTPGEAAGTGDRAASDALARFEADPRYQRVEEILAARPADFRFLRDEAGPKGIPWLQPDEFSPRDYRGGLAAWRNVDSASLELWPLGTPDLEFTTPDWISVEPAAAQDGAGPKRYVVRTKPTPGPGGWRDYAIDVRAGDKRQRIAGRFLTARWDVRWYRWDSPAKLDYTDEAAWRRLFDSTPLHRQTTRDLSPNLWTRGMPAGVPNGHFALVATSEVKFSAGRYALSTLSDDGIRILLDGKEVLKRWNNHGPTPDQVEIDITEGVHTWTVEYCQETGAYALAFNWRRLGP